MIMYKRYIKKRVSLKNCKFHNRMELLLSVAITTGDVVTGTVDVVVGGVVDWVLSVTVVDVSKLPITKR